MKAKSEMKILFKGSRLSGGAPRSALRYIDVLKNDGHRITALVQENDSYLKKEYLKATDLLVCQKDLSSFLWEHDYFRACKLIKQNYRFIKENNFDLLLIDGFLNDYFFGDYCQKRGIPTITMIAGGDLTIYEYALPYCQSDHFICFSKENREVLTKFVDEDKITVISNRIETKECFNDYCEHYCLNVTDTVNVLIASRIHKDKYDSLVRLVNTVNLVAGEQRKIYLVIAGDGDRMSDLRDYCSSLNNPFFTVELKGHVDDLIPCFESAHIVVGKGRSVLEPMMMNRIGCVIGDDGRLEVCTTENFDNLYHYNFSGRHLEKDDPQAELSGLIDSLIDGKFDFSDFEKTVELIRKNYSAEYLPDKLHKVLDSIEEPKKGFSFVSPLLLTLRYIWLKTIRKIRRRFYNGK